MTSTIDGTLSAKIVTSSYADSEDNISRLSDVDETVINYIKVKTTAQKKCQGAIPNITKLIEEIYATNIDIKLIGEGNYKGYFIIISESKKSIDLAKQHLLQIEDSIDNNDNNDKSLL